MIIRQPKNMCVNTFNGSLELKWNKNFGNITSAQFQKAQEYVDETCILFMKPYTPFRNGFLQKAVETGTVIGSGELIYLHPGARYLYYGEVYGPNFPIMENGIVIGWYSIPKMKKHPTGRNLQYDNTKRPMAGKMWFERMKADRKDEILQGAVKIAGGIK